MSPELQATRRCRHCEAPGSAVDLSFVVIRTSAVTNPPWRVHCVCADAFACMRRQLRNRGIETTALHQAYFRRKRTARRLERARERAA